MITKPLLPPKAGYVERVNADGEHYYEPTSETATNLSEKAAQIESESLILELAADHEARICMMELGV